MTDMSTYLAQTNRLLQNPTPTSPQAPLYAQSDLVTYINLARAQLAAETECLRYQAFFSVVSGTQNYAFAAITSGVTGVGSLVAVQAIGAVPSSGAPYYFAAPRPWPWFVRFYVQTGASQSLGRPTVWAQYGEGVGASVYFAPTPSLSATYFADGVFTTSDLLTAGGPPEVIPYPFTDAVPFYAAYYAYLSAQRTEDANVMFGRYKEYALRGRQIITSTVLPDNYPGGVGSRVAASKITLAPSGGGGGGPK